MKKEEQIKLNNIDEVRSALENNRKEFMYTQNAIQKRVELENFIEENNFWTVILPESIGVIGLGAMLLLGSFSLIFAISAAVLMLSPAAVTIANEAVKQKHIKASTKLQKESYYLESLVNSFEVSEQKEKKKELNEKHTDKSNKKNYIETLNSEDSLEL